MLHLCLHNSILQAVAAYVPYMVTVGNHENHYNFSNYKARFDMPKAGGDGQNMFYSYDFGPAHIISFSSEFYWYVSSTNIPLK